MKRHYEDGKDKKTTKEELVEIELKGRGQGKKVPDETGGRADKDGRSDGTAKAKRHKVTNNGEDTEGHNKDETKDTEQRRRDLIGFDGKAIKEEIMEMEKEKIKELGSRSDNQNQVIDVDEWETVKPVRIQDKKRTSQKEKGDIQKSDGWNT